MKTKKIMDPQPPERYEYRGDDGGNPHLPKKSGHYWMNGYAMWRPLKSKCPNNIVGVKMVSNKWYWILDEL